MSYFMRFMLTDGAPPTLAEIEAVLTAEDAAFSILRDSAADDSGDLFHADELLAEIELNRRGDPLCDEDLEEFAEELQKQDDPNREIVLDALDRAEGMVVLHVLRAGHENPTLLNQLWEWLFSTRQGLLQVDEEGFFDREKRIVSLL
jgi:hypothetical protein